MAGDSETKRHSPQDWFRLLIAHLDGQTAREIARSEGLAFNYTRNKLSRMRRMSNADLEAVLTDRLRGQLVLMHAHYACGQNELAGKTASRILQSLRAARELGMMMKTKDIPDDADQRAMDDLPDPREELFKRLDRLTPERREKSLGHAPERGGGVGTSG